MESSADIERLLEHRAWIRGLARRLVGSNAADDVVQDTWIAAIQFPPAADRPAGPWLATVVRRIARRYRGQGRARAAAEPAEPGHSPSAAELVERVDTERKLAREVLGLEESLRTVLLLRYYEGLTAAEIARRLGIPASTVRWRSKRALESLRGRLDGSSGTGASWSAALLELAQTPRSHAPLSTASVNAGLAMTSTAKLVTAAAVVVTIGSSIATWNYARLHREQSARIQLLERELAERGPEQDSAVRDDLADPGIAASALSASAANEPGRRTATVSVQDLARHWLARFKQVPENEYHGSKTARAMTGELGLPIAFDVVLLIWEELPIAQKPRVIGWFDGQSAPRILTLLRMGVDDASFAVQKRSLELLKKWAWIDFIESHGDYESWIQRYENVPLEIAVSESSVAAWNRSRTGPIDFDLLGDMLHGSNLRRWDRIGVDVPSLLKRHGALTDCALWIRTGNEEAAEAMGIARALQPDETWLRRNALPLLYEGDVSSELRSAAMYVLGAPEHAWAREPIETVLARECSKTDSRMGDVVSAAQALAGIEDPASIPAMIRVIVQHSPQNPRLIYDVGYFGLTFLAGVDYDEAHDGAWWLQWWEDNRARFAPEVQAIPVR